MDESLPAVVAGILESAFAGSSTSCIGDVVQRDKLWKPRWADHSFILKKTFLIGDVFAFTHLIIGPDSEFYLN